MSCSAFCLSPPMPTAVLELDLNVPLPSIQAEARYDHALFLIRMSGRPVGRVELPLVEGSVPPDVLSTAILEAAGWGLWEETLRHWLEGPSPPTGNLPTATVAVCTRDRPDDLKRCLDGLMDLPDDGQELLVVDNAPGTDATRALVASYPKVRYVREDRPGLDCARNRALREARGEIVAFTDDDSVPDPNWLRALLPAFADPLVLCATGLTMPLELETEAQEWFERMSTFNRGFRRRVFDLTNHNPLAAGPVGAGVNMALRRRVVDVVGPFVEALDAGTPTQSGGDHEMFVRILRNGYRIVYEPQALNWHRHRQSWEALRKALYGYGVGVYAGFTHHLIEHREWGVFRLAWGWFRHSHAKQLARIVLRRPTAPPLGLVLAELRGCFVGPWAYLVSRRRYPLDQHG